MKSLIGHNQPPKDRKADWKSISINKWVYADLLKIAQNICNKKNCFLVLEGKAPLEKVSIPYAIELLVNQHLFHMTMIETQDNGRNIWEQTSKKLIKTYKKEALRKNDKIQMAQYIN